MSNNSIFNYENHNDFEESLKTILNTVNTQSKLKIIEEDLYYNTAKNIGSKLNITDYDILSEKITELGIGQIRITYISDEKILIRLYKCFTCSNMEYIGKPVCYFEAGILAGAISTITNQDMDAAEVKCNSLGNDFCEFEVTQKTYSTKHYNSFIDSEKKDINLVNLTVHSLNLVKNYKLVQYQTKRFTEDNEKLNEALKNALEINSFNQTIIDSIPNYLAVIDSNGVIVKINKEYREFSLNHSLSIENKNIKALKWHTKYSQVLAKGQPAIWQQVIKGNEYIIFESPIFESKAVLRQVIPLESDFIKLLLNRISDLEKEMIYYKNKAMEKENGIENIENIIVHSDKMKEILNYMKKVSKTDATVLIRGESGTGKTMFAEIIHNESLRSNNPFVYIDCSTIPKNFFEAELFGYEPGAFTGASKDGKIGKLEIADGGTVFLDEIAEIPMEIQSKLLRFLQEKKFEKIGSVTTKKVDVRIITATNQNLEEMISQGLFRKDLYYRLNVINVALPSLRERWQEIPSLANKILLCFSQEIGIEIKEIDKEGMQELMDYTWPGNIRELENLIKRLAFSVDEKVICKNHILKELNAAEKFNQFDNINSETKIKSHEKDLILNMIKKCDYNKSAAADKLGITRQTLYNKMKKYNILY
ncbi:sigma 54-interacting transcriptional regulator [Clostridium sp. DJ247]|uniref:sigma 54-interacting transcriptional regulator n=1 Tax=Clostridium sp. DJ247 TaxID=2726188 RepID=UPI001627A2DD|nr:sigma 54-interacting transcriptional regulator [Clostridium sp. DJ247]MBC2581118.1 sigma 54-interacting transcriptional regulator [Clostridium sp. DJ247]